MNHPISIICLTLALLMGCEDTATELAPPPADGSTATALPGGTAGAQAHLPRPDPAVSSTPNSTQRSDNDSGHGQAAEATRRIPPEDSSQATFAGLTGPVPVTWKWEPPRHHFRVCQYAIPGRDGSEPAELVVTTFPEARGNTIQNNIDRWSQQFRSSEGGPTKPEVSTSIVSNMRVTTVDLSGEYLGMGGGWHKDNYRMLVSIIEAPSASIFIKLLGPSPTVDANADAYDTLIDNLSVSP